MIRFYLLSFAIVSLIYASCTPEELEFSDDSNIQLSFSVDTVLFDTVLTNQSTITKRFRVFNPESKAVRVDISVASGPASSFNIVVNGENDDSFSDQILLGGDSMLILVESFIDPNNDDLPFIVEDSIEFLTNGNDQFVKLLAWGQNANYLNDSILSCNTVWSGSKPYVIFNSVLVDSLCNLTIEPGTQVLSHVGSRILVRGSLDVNGSAELPVVFRNDRFDEPFNSTPGQWGGIFFLEGSKNNRIENAVISNAEYGIWLGTPDEDEVPDLILDRIEITNMSRTGLIAFTSDLEAENLLINNCAEFCIGNLAGGNYSYKHLTIGNFGFTFFREGPGIFVNDQLELADNSIIGGDVSFNLDNCIVWGDMEDEIQFSSSGENQVDISISTSLLKTTSGELDINENILNQDPLFLDPPAGNYRLDSLSPAINAGRQVDVLLDLDNIERDSLPDMGAYEWVEIKN